MLLFVLAHLGGVLTIVSPCILPVLPFVLARADRPFLRNGLPLLLGMALAFTAVATLAAVGGPYPGNLSESAITDTLAGPLVLTSGNATSACPEEGTLSVPCVFRFSATATLSDGTAVGAGYTLLGPYPAVITTAASTALQLDRLS